MAKMKENRDMTTTEELDKKAADLRAVIDQYLPPPSARVPIAGLYPDADHIATELMWGGDLERAGSGPQAPQHRHHHRPSHKRL